MSDNEQLIKRLYDLFNARDIDGVLSNLDDNVAWANGMENTHVLGTGAVREYWTNQWLVIDPHVHPLRVSTAPDDSIVAEVHQIVRDLEGKVLLDEMVGHVFQIENGKVNRFDIQAGSQLSTVSH